MLPGSLRWGQRLQQTTWLLIWRLLLLTNITCRHILSYCMTHPSPPKTWLHLRQSFGITKMSSQVMQLSQNTLLQSQRYNQMFWKPTIRLMVKQAYLQGEWSSSPHCSLSNPLQVCISFLSGLPLLLRGSRGGFHRPRLRRLTRGWGWWLGLHGT